jgi:hypothetical protein
MLWKIEKYRAKEKKFRDSLKKIYQKKIDQVVELKTKNYHKKVLESIIKILQVRCRKLLRNFMQMMCWKSEKE